MKMDDTTGWAERIEAKMGRRVLPWQRHVLAGVPTAGKTVRKIPRADGR